MRIMCFVPDADSPGRRDMSATFLPEAEAFARYWGEKPEHVVQRFPSKGALEQRKAVVLSALETPSPTPIQIVAFFCHGWRSGLQCGLTSANIPSFAGVLARRLKNGSDVVLYACDAGRDADADALDDVQPGPGGDGGFADLLRDTLEVMGRHVTVTAHATTGHSTTNPYVRRFAPGTGKVGGEWYVEPNSMRWSYWRARLREPRDTLRYRFWSLAPEMLEHELTPRNA